jgi:hypothetical protein
LAVKNHIYRMMIKLEPGQSSTSPAKGSKGGSPDKSSPKPNGKARKPAKRKRSGDEDEDAEDFAPKKVKEELPLKEEQDVV